MLVPRLQKLCETRCDKMAFTWCSKALLALRSVSNNHELRRSTSVSHIYYIFVIHLCLLHRFGCLSKFIDEVPGQAIELVETTSHRFCIKRFEAKNTIRIETKHGRYIKLLLSWRVSE